jgi:hypothetical protein
MSTFANLPRQIRGLWLAHVRLPRAKRAAIAAECYMRGEVRIKDPTVELLAKIFGVPPWAISEAGKRQLERKAADWFRETDQQLAAVETPDATRRARSREAMYAAGKMRAAETATTAA